MFKNLINPTKVSKLEIAFAAGAVVVALVSLRDKVIEYKAQEKK